MVWIPDPYLNRERLSGQWVELNRSFQPGFPSVSSRAKETMNPTWSTGILTQGSLAYQFGAIQADVSIVYQAKHMTPTIWATCHLCGFEGLAVFRVPELPVPCIRADKMRPFPRSKPTQLSWVCLETGVVASQHGWFPGSL